MSDEKAPEEIKLTNFQMRAIAWFYALICAAITGGMDGLINMGIAPETYNLKTGRDALIATILIKGAIAAGLYLKKSPLPPLN